MRWACAPRAESNSETCGASLVDLTSKNFLKAPCRISKRASQPYEEVADLEQLQERMVQSLGDYNARSRKPMDLVMFMFAVEHVSRLAR